MFYRVPEIQSFIQIVGTLKKIMGNIFEWDQD